MAIIQNFERRSYFQKVVVVLYSSHQPFKTMQSSCFLFGE
jgi:hypothetical protein